MRALSDVWSGVVDEASKQKEKLSEFEEALKSKVDYFRKQQGALVRRYDALKTAVDQIQASIYDMDHRISYYSGKVEALEGERSEVVSRQLAALERRIDRQEMDLDYAKQEIATLRGNRCRCGEEPVAVESEAGELEYIDEVDPPPLLILIEIDEGFPRFPKPSRMTRMSRLQLRRATYWFRSTILWMGVSMTRMLLESWLRTPRR